MHTLIRGAAAAVTAGLLAFAPVAAQLPSAPRIVPAPQSAPAPLTAEARAAAVDAAAEALRETYVDPEIGERTAARIEAALADGAYDDLTDPWAFADALSEDFQAASADKHLRAAAPGIPRPLPPVLLRPAPPPAEGGVARADILADTIGYIELVAFPGPDAFGPPVDRAMAALADTRAVIVDLRRHGGGSPAAETYFASYFIDSDTPVEFTRIVWRNPGTETYRAQPYFSAETPVSFAGKPVYLLTSELTFSGAEALAYDMRALDLAIVVGETTGGGANPGSAIPLSAVLGMNVPTGRAENPVTESNWEGVGVTPDIATPADDALRAALAELGVETDETGIDALSQARVFTPGAP